MSTMMDSKSKKKSKRAEDSSGAAEKLSSLANRSGFWREPASQKSAKKKVSWESWLLTVGRRSTKRSLKQLCDSDGSPLLWALNITSLSPLATELLELLTKDNPTKTVTSKSTELLMRWLAGTDSQPQSVSFALECLAIAHLLPRSAHHVETQLWWSGLDALWEIVQSTGSWRVDVEVPAEQALAHQILVGEVPLTLAYLMPEMRPLYQLRNLARGALEEGLEELLNGEGLPRAAYVTVFRGLLASWTRCRAMGSRFKQNCWNGNTEEQFRSAVTKSLCLSSSLGTTLLGDPTSPTWETDFLATMLRLGGNANDRTSAFDLLDKKLTQKLAGKSGKVVAETSDLCEWAGLAILRTEYQRTAPVVAVDFSEPAMRLDVWNGPHRLLHGAWGNTTSVDGKSLEVSGTWEQTCWFSDKDVDYLELAIDLSSGVRLERQILLARNDLFLFLADYVMNTSGAVIRHGVDLPLADGLRFAAEPETREGYLVAKNPLARVLPLALPEWRVDPRIGTLTQFENHLQLAQERPGRQMACPLLLDLDPSRFGKQCTWRQLTVASALEIQPPDVAVGYRAQCHKDQWLFYRSLGPSANRTLLGVNTSEECFVGRFLAPSGEVEEMLQVEG